MQMEHRIVSVHRCDRVGIVLGPGAAVFLCDINQALAHAPLLRVLKEMNSLCRRQTAGIEGPSLRLRRGAWLSAQPGFKRSRSKNRPRFGQTQDVLVAANQKGGAALRERD